MKVMSNRTAVAMGYAADRRRRRREHRRKARACMAMGTFLNPGRSLPGSTPYEVAKWHLFQARNLR